MSARGVAFLKDWTARNLGGPEQDSDRAKAARLAKRLVADAAVKGITVADMNLEGYDIEKYLLEAMTARLSRRDCDVVNASTLNDSACFHTFAVNWEQTAAVDGSARRWEYSHVVRAGLGLVGFLLIVIAVAL